MEVDRHAERPLLASLGVPHLKMKIIEFEKFQGPIAQSMVEHFKRRIDAIRFHVNKESGDVREPVL